MSEQENNTPAPVTGILDRSNPRSAISVLPPVMQERVQQAYGVRPDLFGLDERTLRRTLKSEEKTPSPTDCRIKIRFWDEYDRCIGIEGRNSITGGYRITMTRIYEGVCTPDYFYNRYAVQAHLVAWMLTPPADYETACREALTYGIEMMREILEKDHEPIPGKIDHKLLAVKMKIVALMDMRVRGGITQKQLVVSADIGAARSAASRDVAADATQIATVETMEELERKIKELDIRERRSKHIDIDPIEIE